MFKKNTTYSSHPNRASRIAHEKAKSKYPTYDTSLIKPKKNSKPKFFLLIILLLIIIAVIALAVFYCWGCATSMAEGKTVEVTIDEGSSTWQIANKLEESGVINNTLFFKLIVNQMGAESSLKPGTYIFEGGKSLQDYIKILCDGPDSNAPKLLVSEGMRIKTIATKLEQVTKSKITSKEFIDATSNASVYSNKFPFLETAGKNSLEGFLFPKTYFINTTDTCSDIVIKMLEQFNKETCGLNFNYPYSCGLTFYDAIKLASIVEKESAQGVHRLVASVFYNRLKTNMFLNSDATTAYEIGHEPSAEDVHAHSLYSTYTSYGLPPSPICSPGIESIEAVCNPEETNYYYFAFSNDDNENVKYKFSETFEQHQEALINLGIV